MLTFHPNNFRDSVVPIFGFCQKKAVPKVHEVNCCLELPVVRINLTLKYASAGPVYVAGEERK